MIGIHHEVNAFENVLKMTNAGIYREELTIVRVGRPFRMSQFLLVSNKRLLRRMCP